MTFLYWNIGKDITENVLKNQKAEYGKTVIKELSEKLTKEYGRGYGERNVFRMIKFYDYFTDFEILSTLSTKLSWSHFIELLQIPDKLKREFYTTICANECWSVRTLRERIGSALFERTAISKKPEQTIINDFAFLARQKRIAIDGRDFYMDLLFYHRKLKRLVVIELKLVKQVIIVLQ